ncbi:DinB family protein [Paenibacillus sp. 1P03SA]|uniref:DinB family protein n=1 Tax=Paenibacillus sp. 1P03SA TaxID=3132294 RepID=UPI00399F7E36
MDVFENQYKLIQRTRELLFRYCETLSPADYVKEVEPLGGASIRSLHAHVADCYRVWLGSRALGKSLPKIKPESVGNVQEMREAFKNTDALVYEFLNKFKKEWDPAVQASWRSDSVESTELWLFTHTITHEFHHRGQIVKMGRQSRVYSAENKSR